MMSPKMLVLFSCLLTYCQPLPDNSSYAQIPGGGVSGFLSVLRGTASSSAAVAIDRARNARNVLNLQLNRIWSLNIWNQIPWLGYPRPTQAPEDARSGVSGIRGMRENLNNLQENLMTGVSTMSMQAMDLGQVLTRTYQNFTLPLSDRFKSMLDTLNTNVTVVQSMCVISGINCTRCQSAGLVCRLCCPSKMATDPVSLQAALLAEDSSRSSLLTNEWVHSAFRMVGLQSVYQSWITGRQVNYTADIVEMIQTFRFINSNQSARMQASEQISSSAAAVCGYYFKDKAVGRIVGGEKVAGTGIFPWQLSLATGFLGFFYQHRCGAALLTRYWVLTASHCMHSMDVQTTYVMGGFVAINNRNTAQIRRITKSILNANFNPASFEQDVALVRLAEPMVFTTTLLPICLPPPDSPDFAGRTATLTGWGELWDNGPLAEQLMQVDLPVISNEECMKWFTQSGSKQYVPEYSFLCAGYQVGKQDACAGDSGGPLMLKREDSRAQIIGIVSWGIGCGGKNRPGVYTRVSKFIGWIEENIRNNSLPGEDLF